MALTQQELHDLEASILRAEPSAAEEDDLIASYIEPNPLYPGVEEARLVESGVPVWALIPYLRVVENDLARAAIDYDIPIPAVMAAVLYYARHKEAIDARIAANDAPSPLGSYECVLPR